MSTSSDPTHSTLANNTCTGLHCPNGLESGECPCGALLACRPCSLYEVQASLQAKPFRLDYFEIAKEELVTGSNQTHRRELYVKHDDIKGYRLLQRGRRVVLHDIQSSAITYIIERVVLLDENNANILACAYSTGEDDCTDRLTALGDRCLDQWWPLLVVLVREKIDATEQFAQIKPVENQV